MGLERIWAPWRVQYFHQDLQKGGCFLCRAFQGDDDRQNLVLWRGQHSFCMLNRWPYNNGHLLVAPVAHKADLLDLDDEVLLEQMCLLRRCKRRLSELLAPDGFNMGLNLGRSAGAGVVDHLHWHIVPRWQGDSNFMPAVAGAKIISQSLGELWEQLRRIDSD